MERLSDQQATILLKVFEHQRRKPRRAFRWEPSKWSEEWSSAKAASISRSLRLLACRGLILRIDEHPDRPFKRTGYVYLTEKGLAVARALAKNG